MVDEIDDASYVLAALESALAQDVNTASVPLKVMGLVNTDANVAVNGWIGVYVDRSTYRPRTIGTGSGNWQFTPTFKIVVQWSDQDDSKNAYRKLEGLVTKVVNVILASPALQGLVEALASIDVDYAAHEDDAKSLHLEGALLTLTYLSTSKR